MPRRSMAKGEKREEIGERKERREDLGERQTGDIGDGKYTLG